VAKPPILTVTEGKGKVTPEIEQAVDLMVKYRIDAVTEALKKGGYSEEASASLLKSALKKVTPKVPRKKKAAAKKKK